MTKGLTTIVFAAYIAGCLSAAPDAKHLTFTRWMQGAFWPVYISYVEVGKYFERNMDTANPSLPEGDG